MDKKYENIPSRKKSVQILCVVLLFFVLGLIFFSTKSQVPIQMGAAIGTEGLELKWSGDYRLFLPGTIDKININTADQEALQALPGVGEKLAKAIVQYRKEKGLYHTVDEIVNVPGIGLKKLNQIKEFTIAE